MAIFSMRLGHAGVLHGLSSMIIMSAHRGTDKKCYNTQCNSCLDVFHDRNLPRVVRKLTPLPLTALLQAPLSSIEVLSEYRPVLSFPIIKLKILIYCLNLLLKSIALGRSYIFEDEH